MTTKIADVIIPEVFNPYVIQRTMELSELYQSGILSTGEEFDRLASSSSHVVNMPFWNDLTGEDEVLTDQGALTPGKITAGQDIAVILRRGRAWGANDLAAALAGDDPMLVIGDLVADYWRRRMQAALISILKGVFAAPTMATNLHDISANTGDAAKFTGATFIDALQKLGDAKEKLTAVVMHSAVEAALSKQNLIQTIQPSENMPQIKTYMGKRVIVDDSCPVDTTNGVFTTFIFAQGAIGYGNGNPVGFVPTETDRDSLAGEDYLITRKTFILHPRGVKYVGAPNPSNTELENGTNWERVYEPKAIRMVAFIHKI
ncbi:major capsid protein [Carboxydothermus hydrogenoformans]|uniref:Prophage LambdaCh01, coat protein n=1 Tax=Carboxydothermus hydrogenoformans (strain ATCC BAA-161 / DSM 6008 / Z-2901) TaxID=246194 RepID=Q3ABJ3_CARHZ|nr:major capsid protein [Carboxydothermus hydrogenoformans]ABB14121.1 prophage LambdaCh01, coat protein [Carboxydothermus hydrogenoformans Z-2901]